jgi:hypothetical protein
MICPECHRKDMRNRVELVEMSSNQKAMVCHVCGTYACSGCGGALVPDPPILPYPYKGRTQRLHRCRCGKKVYLEVSAE